LPLLRVHNPAAQLFILHVLKQQALVLTTLKAGVRK